MKETRSELNAKPFLKWAGGKTQLLPTLDAFLPATFREERDVTYIEPFIGGGALLFHMLRKYPNIQRAIINDINPRLITTYRVVRDNPAQLIDALKELQAQYRAIHEQEDKKDFFLTIRQRFNTQKLSAIDEASLMIFLNRTCFNGLYRENSKGAFNVPFGRYANPAICDEALIMADSQVLQRVEILNDDYSQITDYLHGYTFIYFDPPYRPLDATSNFNSYVKTSFNDREQLRLKEFFDYISRQGCHEMLSNSDCRSRNEHDLFFDNLYEDYFIERVYAKRNINSNASKRGVLPELLIRNYAEYQGTPTY